MSASATVEAALVIPIFVYAILAVMFMIQVIAVKSKVMQGLYETTRKLDGYAYEYQKVQSDTGAGELLSGSVSKTLAYTTLITMLGNDFGDKGHIVGESLGLSVLESKIMDQNNEIYLKVHYMIRNPFDVFGIAIVPVEQSFTGLAWLGEEYKASGEDSKDDQIVYITESGSVYHKDRHCTYLEFHIRTVPTNDIKQLRNADGAIYYPCEKCGGATPGEMLYVTDYGNRYHTSINCSKLRRNILSIPLSEVGNRRPCSKCGS